MTSRIKHNDSISCIGLIVVCILSLPVMFFSGWVCSLIWRWYVMHAFENAPTVNTVEFVGIACLLSVLRYRMANTPDISFEEWVERLIVGFCSIALVLGLAYAIKEIWL